MNTTAPEVGLSAQQPDDDVIAQLDMLLATLRRDGPVPRLGVGIKAGPQLRERIEAWAASEKLEVYFVTRQSVKKRIKDDGAAIAAAKRGRR